MWPRRSRGEWLRKMPHKITDRMFVLSGTLNLISVSHCVLDANNMMVDVVSYMLAIVVKSICCL